MVAGSVFKLQPSLSIITSVLSSKPNIVVRIGQKGVELLYLLKDCESLKDLACLNHQLIEKDACIFMIWPQ